MDFRKFKGDIQYLVESSATVSIDFSESELREMFDGASALMDKGYYMVGKDIYFEGSLMASIPASADWIAVQRFLEYLGCCPLIDPRLSEEWESVKDE